MMALSSNGLVTMSEDLGTTLLGSVLSRLAPKTLLVCKAVCKHWRLVASDVQVRKAAFVHHWNLLGVHGQPRNLQLFETASVPSFVRQHAVVRTDTLQMLAVRHGIDVPTLKRVNNLMTDHSLHSRTHLFIPVASRQQVEGQLVSFAFCPLAKREFVVLRGTLHEQHHQQQDEMPDQQRHVQQTPGHRFQGSTRFKLDALEVKLCQLLGRSLHVDDSTAKFYLDEANGDVKAAMEAFAQDVAWEGTTAGPIRTAPVQRWIEGKVGL